MLISLAEDSILSKSASASLLRAAVALTQVDK